jgi:ankyrin repeat protein
MRALKKEQQSLSLVTRVAAFVLTVCSLCSVNAAQTSLPSFRWDMVRKHELLPHPIYFVGKSATNQFPMASLPLKLTVSPAGEVTAVEFDQSPHSPMPDPKSYDWQAIRRTVLRWKFVPFTVKDKPVTASIEESVYLVGPRRKPSEHVIPPVIKPDSNISITLKRTQCYGPCPAYTLRIDAHTIRYEGTYATVVEGVHYENADPAKVRQLAQRFLDANFYSLDDEYALAVTDLPSYIVSISIDGRAKSVTDYRGVNVGMPLVVLELEDAVDMLARSDRWVLGRQGLVQSLKSEGYDFHTTDAQSVLKRAIVGNQAKTAEELLQAGVPLEVLPGAQPPAEPLISFDPSRPRWLYSASYAAEVMPVLLRTRASEHDQEDKDSALQNAAQLGDLDMVQELIRYGANPKATFEVTRPKGNLRGQPLEIGGSVLISAAASGNPAVVREILQYHPDLEAKDSQGRTAVFRAAHGHPGQGRESLDRVECLKVLAAASANPNARDNLGDTTMWETAADDVREELLKMGLDINAENNEGETVLFGLSDVNAVPFFAQNGLDLSVRNHHGEDAIQSYQHRRFNFPQMQVAIEKAFANGDVAPR